MAPFMPERRTRLSPRISVNKLGEYMIAKAGRRRTIISDQKHPKDFVVARYSAVYDAIAKCLAAGGDPLIIHEAMEHIYEAAPKSMWQQQDLDLSAQALDLFLNIIDEIKLEPFNVVRTPDRPPAITIASVEVSVRPELHLQDRVTGSLCGAVKLYISKRGPLNDDAALYVGAVLHQYMNEVLARGTTIDAQNCVVIDIFAQQIFQAPRNYKRRQTDLVAACEEIARAWSSV